jgi:hypothetical protein
MKQYNENEINELNNDNCKGHNKVYKIYCIDCKKHLCLDCLKSRKHVGHLKNSIVEILPNETEIKILENIIKYYDNKISKLEKAQINKTRNINKQLEEYKNKLYEKNELIIKQNKNNLEKELKLNEDSYIKDINKMRRVFENEIKSRKYQYELSLNNINNKYKKINEISNIIYLSKIEKIDDKYLKIKQKLGYEEKIENLNYLKRFNEIIFNTFHNYKNNYFNAININNALDNYYNNKAFVYNKLNKEYNNIIRIRKEKDKVINIIKKKRIK